MIVRRISAVIRHVRQGTLSDRIKAEFHNRLRNFRCNHWQYYKKTRTYIDTPIAKNIMMRLYTDDVLSHLIYCKGHEYNERQFLSSFLKPGDVFIDVGANSGLYTLLASALVDIKGKVYAFEPSPAPFKRLQENISLYGHNNVECIEAALGDHEGKKELNISANGYSAWDTFTGKTGNGHADIINVQVRTLDRFVSDRDLLNKIIMMKIDVEGWETHVLSGGINTLAGLKAPVLQIEFTDKVTMPAGITCQSLYQQTSSLGYQLCIYDNKTGQLRPDPPRNEYPNLNLYAVKNLEMVNQRLLDHCH